MPTDTVTPHTTTDSASAAEIDHTEAAAPSTAEVSNHTSGWALAFLVTLAAGWLLWRRNHRLALEAQRLSHHQRVLKSVNDRLQSESQQLRQQVTSDPLTGALSRQAFASGLRELLEHVSRYGHVLQLIVLDLDHFKAINDHRGHLAGDNALKLVTGIVHEHLVSADLFGRFGGDEFLIVSVDRDLQATTQLANAIRTAVASAAREQIPSQPGLTLSMGVAQADSTSGYSADALFARADAALYAAKRRGRNQVVVADDDVRPFQGAEKSARHL